MLIGQSKNQLQHQHLRMKVGEVEMKEMSTDELLDDLDYCGYDPYYDNFRKDIVAEIRRRLEEQQKIVRCEDCKFGYCLNPSCDIENRYYQCLATYINGMRIVHKSNWFCADGRKRE